MGVPVTPDQQDRRGLAARRRPDPRAPLRPGDQHADRLRRPRRRLRDPHRRGPPRHPLRDDDDRRLRRGRGRSPRRSEGDAEVRSPAGDPRGAARGRRSRDDAPRSAAGSARSPRTAPRAATGSSRCSTARARARSRASSTCSPPSAHWEERGERPFLPRAFSVADAEPAASGVRLDFLVEGVGPGTDRLCELEAGRAGLGQRPARQLLLARPRELAPGRRRGDPGRRRHRDRAAGDLRRQLRRARRPDPGPARLPRPRRTPAASTTSSPAARSARQRGRPRRPPRLRHRPARRRCSRATTPPAPPSTPAARRRCSRRCG